MYKKKSKQQKCLSDQIQLIKIALLHLIIKISINNQIIKHSNKKTKFLKLCKNSNFYKNELYYLLFLIK